MDLHRLKGSSETPRGYRDELFGANEVRPSQLAWNAGRWWAKAARPGRAWYAKEKL